MQPLFLPSDRLRFHAGRAVPFTQAMHICFEPGACAGDAVARWLATPYPALAQELRLAGACDVDDELEDCSRRLSPYNAARIDLLERVIERCAVEIDRLGVVAVQGPWAYDLPSAAMIVNAIARVAARRSVHVDADPDAFSNPFADPLARQAAYVRLDALRRSLAQLSSEPIPPCEAPATASRRTGTPSPARECLLRNEPAALAAIAERPVSAQLLVAKAISLARLGLTAPLRETADQIAGLAGSDVERAVHLARAASLRLVAAAKLGGLDYWKADEPAAGAAIAALLPWVHRDEDAAAAAAWLCNNLALVQVQRAIAERDRGRLGHAQSLLSQALRLAAACCSHRSTVLRFNLINNAGKLIDQTEGPAAALRLLSTFALPDHPGLAYRRAVLHAKAGDSHAAAAKLDEATGLLLAGQWPWRCTIDRARAIIARRDGDGCLARRLHERCLETALNKSSFRTVALQRASLDADDAAPPSGDRLPPKIAPYVPEFDVWDAGGPTVDDRLELFRTSPRPQAVEAR